MKTKKILSLTLTLIMILSVIVITPTASAVTLKSGNFQYTILGKNSVAIVKYTGKAKNLKIPSKIAGRNVTQLNNHCLAYSEFETVYNSVVIPDTVTTVKSLTFSDTKIGTLTIGKNIKNIYAHTLNVTNKIVSNNKRYKSKSGVLYNKNMTELLYYPTKKHGTSFTIPKSVKVIGKSAFSYNHNLKNIKLNKVEIIKEYAFLWCDKLATISITKNVTKIKKSAFAGCEKVTALKINANSKLKIYEHAFDGLKIKSLNVPKVTGNGVFVECEQLTKIVIPSNIKTIYREEFFGCTKLKTVTIPPTVTKIGKHAFGFRSPDSKYESNYNHINGFTIKGVKGSAAEKYAKANKIKFVAIKW